MRKILVVKQTEPWGVTHQQRWHSEALQTYGERVIVRHRWNIADYAAGRVNRCYSCGAGIRLNEKQRVRVDATLGTFTLTFAGQTTGSLQWDASKNEVQAALEGLEVLQPDDLTITGTTIDEGFVIEFRGQWAYRDSVPLLAVDDTNLTGTAEVIQVQASSGGDLLRQRVASVYKQSGDSWCSSCYGIGFEGGFEPVIYVTYAMIRDQIQETTRSRTGVMQRQDPTAQFSFEPPVEEFDLMVRVESWAADNVTPTQVHGRFILREVQPVTLRTGPGTPDETLSFMPPEFRSNYQMPDRSWVIGQRCGIEVVPFEHPWNLVPISRQDELLSEMGIVETRRWYKKAEAETALDPRMTNPL